MSLFLFYYIKSKKTMAIMSVFKVNELPAQLMANAFYILRTTINGEPDHLQFVITDSDGSPYTTMGDEDLAQMIADVVGAQFLVDSVTINNTGTNPVPIASVQLGEVQENPTEFTLADRLKAIAVLLNHGLPGAFTTGGGVKVGLVDALPAGTASIGAVGSNSVVSSVTFSRPADILTYGIRDVISDSTSSPTVLQFSNMARGNGGSGTIVKARLMTNQSSNVQSYLLHLFHTAPTPIADNNPYALLFANADKHIGAIEFPAMTTEGTGSDAATTMRPNANGAYGPPNLWYKCAANDTKLYGILTTITGGTPASSQQYYIELGADGLS